MGNSFTVCNADFSKEGIVINVDKTVKENKVFIAWNDVGVRYYTSHLTIYAKSDAANIHRGYYYLDDYNAGVLRILMTWIVKEKD